MRRPPLPLLVLIAFVLPGALAVPALSAQSKTVNVKIGERPHFFFVKPNPTVPTVTVNKGDRLRWRWCPDTRGCSSEHNVVGYRDGKVRFKHPRNALDSVGKTSGSYVKTFATPGTYRVVCTIHDFAMQVKVRR
jgi:plastocyanin